MRTRNLFHALTCAASLALAGCGGGDAPPEPEQEALREVSVAQVQLRPLTGGITASGILAAREEAAVGAEVGGYRVTEVLAEEGDYVRAGQPLVRMDPGLLRAEADRLEANLAQQRAQAAQEAREARRVAGLDGEGVVATEEIEQRRTAAATAAAQVRAAEAQLAELRTRIDRLTVRAPVSGRILERTVRPGEIAAAGGAAMFRIARAGLVELRADVPEAELGSIRPGQPVEVRLPTGETVRGEVRMVAAEVAEQSRLGSVIVSLPADPDLRPGGFAQADFAASVEQAPAAPQEALRFDADGVSVMALGSGNRARRVPVQTGRRANGWVELVTGPSVSTWVMLGGGAFVLEGERVRPVRRPAAARPASAGADGAAETTGTAKGAGR